MAGALQGNTASLRGNIVDNGSLLFNQGMNRNFRWRNLRNGLSHKDQDSGDLTLTGANTYAGGDDSSSGGVLRLTTDSNLGAAGKQITVSPTTGGEIGTTTATAAGATINRPTQHFLARRRRSTSPSIRSPGAGPISGPGAFEQDRPRRSHADRRQHLCRRHGRLPAARCVITSDAQLGLLWLATLSAKRRRA